MMNANTARTLTDNAVNKRNACQASVLETVIAENTFEWENKIATCASLCLSHVDLDTQKAYDKAFTMLPKYPLSRAEVNEAIANYMRSYGYHAELMRNSTVRICW